MIKAMNDKINNKIVGTWILVSAVLETDNNCLPLFGKNPEGSLIFTKEMRFNVILNDPNVPKFSTEDRSQGTYEELKVATTGALALYGTYKVDEQGDFASQHIIGSTFPNWNGLERSASQLRLERNEDLLTENLILGLNTRVIITWQLIE